MCQPVYICRTIRTSIRSEQTVNKINPTYVFMCTKTASFKYEERQTIRATNVQTVVLLLAYPQPAGTPRHPFIHPLDPLNNRANQNRHILSP